MGNPTKAGLKSKKKIKAKKNKVVELEFALIARWLHSSYAFHVVVSLLLFTDMR